MNLTVGDVVALNMPMLGCEIGTRGVVYETYEDFDNKNLKGASIIFENGNYDGFSVEEQGVFLVKENVFPYQKKPYEFSNVMKLTEDFIEGYWDQIFV